MKEARSASRRRLPHLADAVRRGVPLLIALVALFATPAGASVGAVKPVGDADPATATIRVLAELEEIREDGTLLLAIEDDDQVHKVELRLPEDVPIRAQKKKEFDGRRKLVFADLRAGQNLRFTYLPAEKRIVSVTVLKRQAA